MEVSTETLRLLLGLKLKALRQGRGASLKEVAEQAGVSISYLSEIEKGKKYPKPAKLLDLARALGVSFDDLVSQRVEEGLAPLKDAIRSPFLQEFPFQLFGIEPEDLLALVAGAPEKTAGLVRVLDEVARDYDMRVKHFLFAALRAYQLLHRNHFPDLEAGAAAYRQRRGWPATPPPTADALREILEREHGYRIDTATLPSHPELHGLRSVYRAAEARGNGHPELLVNGRLLPEQLAFLYAREIGFLELGLAERPATSSWVRVQRFEPVFNNFRASYFAGSLLVAEEALRTDLDALFARERWDADALGALLVRHRTTPEMFFYRVAQLVPAHFGLADLYFMRFTRRAGEEHAHLTKVLNMSRVPLPHGLRRELDYEKRWAAIGGVRALTSREAGAGPAISAQRSHFAEGGVTFFEVTLSRSLSLGGGASSVTLGFLMTDAFRQRVRFADDPAVPDVEVVYDAGSDRHRARVEALAALGVRLD